LFLTFKTSAVIDRTGFLFAGHVYLGPAEKRKIPPLELALGNTLEV